MEYKFRFNYCYRFSGSIGLTIILASIFLKTNRIFRIFYTQFRRDPDSTTPFGQVRLNNNYLKNLIVSYLHMIFLLL